MNNLPPLEDYRIILTFTIPGSTRELIERYLSDPSGLERAASEAMEQNSSDEVSQYALNCVSELKVIHQNYINQIIEYKKTV